MPSQLAFQSQFWGFLNPYLGDSLLQLVLDDPLLALGKESDLSFQLLHGTWRVEKILHDIISRDCTLEIIFFESRASFEEALSANFRSLKRIFTRQYLPEKVNT